MNLDAPVLPPDPAKDAQRRARRDRRIAWLGLGAVALLVQFSGVIGSGALVGGLLHDRAVVGAIGMVLAWGIARGVLLAFGLASVAAALPALSQRVDRPLRVPRTATVLGGFGIAAHIVVFAAMGALAGLACGWTAGVLVPWQAALMLGLAGALMGALTLLAPYEVN